MKIAGCINNRITLYNFTFELRYFIAGFMIQHTKLKTNRKSLRNEHIQLKINKPVCTIEKPLQIDSP